MLSFPLFLTALVAPVFGVSAGLFYPEQTVLLGPNETRLPYLVNLTATQTANATVNSWYAAAYVRSLTDGHDYMILSALIPALNTTVGMHRSSLIDVTDPSRFFQHVSPVPASGTPPGPGLNFTYTDDGTGSGAYGFQSLSADAYSVLRTYLSLPSPSLSFDFTIRATAPILLYGGLGMLSVGGSSCEEWSIPAGETSGTFSINGTEHKVDSAHSLSWYDRQLVLGLPPTAWTWMGLHVGPQGNKSKDTKIGIWVYDNPGPVAIQFATVRSEDGSQQVVPISFDPQYTRSYYSNATGFTFPLDWTITWPDGSAMSLSSIRADQELVGQGGDPLLSAYEGYVTITGELLGEAIEGFGVVEVASLVPPS